MGITINDHIEEIQDEYFCNSNNGISSSSHTNHDTNNTANNITCVDYENEIINCFPAPLPSSSQCQQLSLEIVEDEEDFTDDSLMSKLSLVDDHHDHHRSIRKITITYSSQIAYTIGHFMDFWMTSRPWWYIVEEGFPTTTTSTTTSTRTTTTIQSQPSKKEKFLSMTLFRTPSIYEDYLTYVALVQYPLLETTCQQSAMFLGKYNFQHPGYGSVLTTYFDAHYNHPFAVLSTYISTTNRPYPLDDLPFISAEDCTLANRWLCAFLPLTNCSTPSEVTSCRKYDCVREFPFDWFTSASTSGVGVKKIKDTIVNNPRNELQKVWYNNHPDVKQLPEIFRSQPNKLFHHEDRHRLGQTAKSIYMHLFLLRPNVFYRARIDAAIRLFAMENKFDFNHDRCIAVHMRRGDRAIPDHVTNISDYCSKIGDEGDDLGCGGVPFIDMTVKGVLAKAQRLVGSALPIRTIIIATDDHEHVRNATLSLTKQQLNGWRVLVITPSKEAAMRVHSHDYQYFRSKLGTAGGVHLMSTIRILQRCEGFIGHGGSESAELFIRAMCVRHYNYFGICPFGLDWRNRQSRNNK
eukprot:gene7462-8249_t